MAANYGAIDETALFDRDGQRKYLCGSEGKRFLRAADQADDATRLFCRLLNFTGCRISEALELTPRHLDAESGRVVFRTLKRRKRVFRAVPVPHGVMRELVLMTRDLKPDERLWAWCRQTAWRHVKQVMADAEIDGPQAAPRGLRHQFGIRAAERGVPMPLAQRWMGHASLRTTAIYQQAAGDEERRLAGRMWGDGVQEPA